MAQRIKFSQWFNPAQFILSTNQFCFCTGELIGFAVYASLILSIIDDIKQRTFFYSRTFFKIYRSNPALYPGPNVYIGFAVHLRNKIFIKRNIIYHGLYHIYLYRRRRYLFIFRAATCYQQYQQQENYLRPWF